MFIIYIAAIASACSTVGLLIIISKIRFVIEEDKIEMLSQDQDIHNVDQKVINYSAVDDIEEKGDINIVRNLQIDERKIVRNAMSMDCTYFCIHIYMLTLYLDWILVGLINLSARHIVTDMLIAGFTNIIPQILLLVIDMDFSCIFPSNWEYHC